MGDYSSTWSDGDNGYTGDDDFSSKNSSKSRIYENVPPDGQNVPSSAYSENMSERVIAKLNKEGVIYRRDNKSTSEGDKESESSKKGAYSSKYFTSVHKDEDVDEDDVKEDELDNANGTTPAPSVARKLMNDDPQPSVLFNCSKGDQTDPIQITNDLPARSSSSLSLSAFASARLNGPQKRKRMPSAKVRSPYLSEKSANKCQIREGKTPQGHLHSVDALLQVNDLTEDHIEAAVSLVKELSNNELDSLKDKLLNPNGEEDDA
ncbi:hypothetical protein ACQ4PT_006584 [Festuca glaucescens]